MNSLDVTSVKSILQQLFSTILSQKISKESKCFGKCLGIMKLLRLRRLEMEK